MHVVGLSLFPPLSPYSYRENRRQKSGKINITHWKVAGNIPREFALSWKRTSCMSWPSLKRWQSTSFAMFPAYDIKTSQCQRRKRRVDGTDLKRWHSSRSAQLTQGLSYGIQHRFMARTNLEVKGQIYPHANMAWDAPNNILKQLWGCTTCTSA